MIRSLHSNLLDAERYPATNLASANARIRDLESFAYKITNGRLGNYPFMWAFASRDIGAEWNRQCGETDYLRLVIYEVWAQVLIDQAKRVFLSNLPECNNMSTAFVRYKIANDAATLSNLATAGRQIRDPDVRHADELLRRWAREYAVPLPPLSAGDRMERLLSYYGDRYQQAAYAAPSRC